MKSEKHRLYYGWIVCGVCTLLLFITMGTASNGLSVFMPYIMKEYSLTGAQTSSLVTLRCTFAFISMLLIGHYYDRVGYRMGTALAALCCCGAYVIYGFASSYLQFCIGASIAGISYGLGSMIPVAILMNRWFVRHRALTIGICSAGSTLAVILLPSILTSIILRHSLHSAFLFTASYSLAASVLVFLLIREKPADKGLEPLGWSDAAAQYRARDPQAKRAGASWTSRSLSRKGWLLMALVSVTMGALGNPGFMHLTVLFTTEGYAPMTVALLISVSGIVMTAFKVLCGETADVFGSFRASALFFGVFIAGNLLCCLAFTGSVPLATVSVIIFGIGSPICTVGIPVWAGDLVSEEHYSETVRRLQLIYAAGAMVFATMPGILADLLGSYIPVYGLFAAMILAAFACLAGAYRLRR
ncbi:MAG: MFS transporter [Firmicutes bacterium]|nr:MFS transporter [Bacillota bacterium]